MRGSKEELNRQLAEAAVGDTKAAQEAMQQRVAALRKQLSEEQKDREAITKAAEIAARQKDAAIHEAHELVRVGKCLLLTIEWTKGSCGRTGSGSLCGGCAHSFRHTFVDCCGRPGREKSNCLPCNLNSHRQNKDTALKKHDWCKW